MWIFCCGMQRSGSTLQFQITAQLVEAAGLGKRVEWVRPELFGKLRKAHAADPGWKVFKMHVCTDKMANEFHQQNAMGVYVYRDLRDVMVSMMRKYNIAFEALLDGGFVDDCLLHYQRWTSLPRVLVSKYETMMANLVDEVARIASHLGVALRADQYRQIAAEHSMAQQKQRIEAAKNDGNLRRGVVDSVRFDPHTNLHTNHIHEGEIGGWKNALSREQIARLEAHAGDWLQARGYELASFRNA